MPQFSVILPVYNIEAYLRDALNSVLNQTCPDWECLCVDDGSTDGSGAILDEYAQKDKRFKVFHTENRGVSAARNLALDHATSDWLAFLDGDDAYNTTLFETLSPLKDVDKEIDLVQFQPLRVHDMLKSNPPTRTKHSVHDLRKRIPRFATQSYCWNKIYRRELAGGVRFENSPLGEDTLYSFEWVRRARKILLTEFCGYIYRIRPGSASHSALTYAKFHAHFKVRLAMAKIWLGEGRRAPYALKVSSLVKVSGRTSLHFQKIPPSPEKEAFLQEWTEGLTALLPYPLPPHYRFAFRTFIKHPRLHGLLFGLPFRFKRFIHVKRTINEIKKKLFPRRKKR